MTLSPGTLYCTRMAVADDEAAVSIPDQLWTHGRRHSEPRSA